MMSLLLKHEGYPPAVVVAVLLHGLLLWFIFDRSMESREFVKIDRPASIAASTVAANPQRLRRIEQLELQRQQERKLAQERQQRQQREEQTRREAAERERQRVADQQKAELQRKQAQDAQRKKQEQDRQRVTQEEARKREQERAQQAAREQANRDAAAKAEAQRQAAVSEEQSLVSQYAVIIKDLITQNWQLSADARNGMSAWVELKLTPTGDIVSSTITQSSGSALFDRSVLQAVTRVGSFPELRELPIAVFERNFRSITLQFQPEDLLR
jgi:colicin import membrane protein